MKKAIDMFGSVAAQTQLAYGPTFEQLVPGCFSTGPKISRGEQYKELPYVILDQPRIFSREQVFAFRSIFWWGHYFIQVLHLKGMYQHQFASRLLAARERLGAAGFYVSVGTDEWEHDFENGSYQSLNLFSDEQLKAKLAADPFIKIAITIPLNQWNEAMECLLDNYRLISVILTLNFPGN